VVPPEDFRRALAHFATGVTVITTCDADARPSGLTVSAFASVSLDPPLVLACVDHKSQTYPALLERGRFAVNILRADQEAISRRFASTRLDKFESIPFCLSPLGLPLIEGAVAHLECLTVSTYDGGDHTIFLGRVERASVAGGEPLLYFGGRYDRLDSMARPRPPEGP
jgi:flavin reductase (DIM6/NTAB) family NADH-FMN oxidoreductase RutF